MCAIFGVLDFRGKLTPAQRRAILRELANAAQIRGTDASGVAYVRDGAIQIQKAPRPASKMRWRIHPEARYLMGHTRMTTQGAASKNYNNHPFPGRAGSQPFALAHNGVLYNDMELRRTQRLPATKIETDSYVAVQLIEKCGRLSADSLCQMAEAMDGTFTITVLDANDTLYLVKGNNPLVIRLFPGLGCYLYASTGEILDIALDGLGWSQQAQTGIPITRGDIMAIDAQGRRTITQFDDVRLRTPEYFCGWGWPCRTAPDEPDDYLETVLDYGKHHGVPEWELQLLLDAGYDAFDIEQLIFDNPFRESCVREIMADFGVR
ncbi:MAG: hypothetical protein HDT37_00285 [Clostridiales bacterium]|nr:hypothetical protein [Clostridiales bacterium]